jgi:hypothetical protein
LKKDFNKGTLKTMMRTKTTVGTFRKKRNDTLVKSIEKIYNVDFGVRSDMKLSTLLKKQGYPSLGKMLEGK